MNAISYGAVNRVDLKANSERLENLNGAKTMASLWARYAVDLLLTIGA